MPDLPGMGVFLSANGRRGCVREVVWIDGLAENIRPGQTFIDHETWHIVSHAPLNEPSSFKNGLSFRSSASASNSGVGPFLL